MKHLRFGGSKAARTIACPGWHVLADTVPSPVESEYAATGTALHECMPMLDDNPDLSALPAKVTGIEITDALKLDKLAPALAATDELLELYGIHTYDMEAFVQLAEDIGGSVDLIGASNDTLLILDYKFGDGVMVYPEDNAQGLHYALCATRTKELDDMIEGRTRLVIAIIQPTSRDDHETLRVWETDFDRLRNFEHEYIEAVNLARKATAEDSRFLDNGEHCRFCPAEPICPLKTGLAAAAKRLALKSPHINTIGEALTTADELEQWITALRKFAHEQADQGVKIPGRKLVMKRASRVYADVPEVERIVKNSRRLRKDETHTSTLLSPAQMEKLYKAKGLDFSAIDEHIAKVSSGTTLVPASDKRPEAPAIAALAALSARVE